MLSAAVEDELTEAPSLVKSATLDLNNHIEVLPAVARDGLSSREELETIQPHLCHAHDQQFQRCNITPPWKVIIIPLTSTSSTPTAFWVSFSYCHSHGDGTSGAIFHRTFLSALRDPALTAAHTSDPVFQPSSLLPLLPAFESLAPFPLKWTYLLGPVLGALLPRWLANLLRVRSSISPTGPNMWTATRMSCDPSYFRTGLQFAVASAATVSGLLKRCRERKPGVVKLTAVLHELIVRALSASLPAAQASSFVAQTPLNLRGAVSAMGRDDFGPCVSVAHHVFPRALGEEDGEEGDLGEEAWARAAETTAVLKERSASLVNQPVALMKYVTNYRGYLQKKIGAVRDCSYGISNIMAFDPEEGRNGKREGHGWTVDQMVFSQPADAIGCPVWFNVASVKGGDMVVTLTWQRSALGIEGGDEDAWARHICSRLERGMRSLAGM
ncbi:Alcohol acetyltransferase [Macrophomina phaseolina MS6]|uniref:Alcohol acetyltransferase n=1 Tax=Macrophomina phaseolina (strain MS6) TaxID=1126212 RepID=K2S0V3_MACPH|nr:Alcohol acetyltransferase [Macrophomina phaseolina MS6]